MNPKNKHVQPFILVFSSLACLLVFSQLTTEITLFGYTTKKVAPLDEIIARGTIKKVALPHRIITDSLIHLDHLAVKARAVDSANIVDFTNDSSAVALAHFFESLNKTLKQKHKTRIAYFGDSMIEGDLITQDFRSYLQDKFGGNGVGFVPVTSIVAGFRTSIRHSFEGWTTYNLLQALPQNHSLGISGYSFVPQVNTTTENAASWVKYTAVQRKHNDKFYNLKVLYGNSASENYVSINGNRYKLTGTKAVNELVVNNETPVESITARFNCTSPLDIYGFSMESDSGVFVDNFSFRGNSGMPLVKVNSTIYKQTNECLNYDLIVLQYGLNVVSPKVTDYSWYEHAMNNVIKQLKASFPETSILIISVGDKSYRVNEAYQTEPGIPVLVETQKQIAKKNSTAFWSLYDAMGGYGTMVKWVECDTPLANKDYTHLNFKGAHKVGKLFYEKLMSEYKDYNKEQFRKNSLSEVTKNEE